MRREASFSLCLLSFRFMVGKLLHGQSCLGHASSQIKSMRLTWEIALLNTRVELFGTNLAIPCCSSLQRRLSIASDTRAGGD
jgi:hypothetical protein